MIVGRWHIPRLDRLLLLVGGCGRIGRNDRVDVVVASCTRDRRRLSRRWRRLSGRSLLVTVTGTSPVVHGPLRVLRSVGIVGGRSLRRFS